MSNYARVSYALAAAHRGWHVFPLVAGSKKPQIRGWEEAATTEAHRLRSWWHRWPEANIGIATGPSHLVVVDCDTPKPGQHPPEEWNRPGITDGVDVLASLASEAGARLCWDTFIVKTRRGGFHFYYTTPEIPGVANTSQKAGWLIDTRATGGYVVGPGSRVGDEPAGTYSPIITDTPAALPAWLAPHVTPQPQAPQARGDDVLTTIATTTTRRSAYVSAAIRGELDKVLHAPEGTRNTSVYVAAASLGQLAAQGMLTSTEITQMLAQAAHQIGLDEGEAHATIRSGLHKGLTQPRITTKAA